VKGERMTDNISQAELEAYLDESLTGARMAAIEEALRGDAELQKRLTSINGRRDAGVHSLGEIWRRHRLSCPSREQLGSYLLGVLARDEGEYVRFHLETIECRYCLANIDDLRSQQASRDTEGQSSRRKRYFQSSAGYLRKQG